MKHGKKYQEAAKLVDRAVMYDAAEAISLVKKTATAKFDETVEGHIRTGCDGRHADQQIRGAVVLPHGTGKKVRILVFAKDAKALELKAGVVEGTVYDSAALTELAKIPSREELLSKLLGSLQSPITNLARVLNQIAEQGGAEACAANAASEAPAEEAAEAPAAE